MWWAGDRAKHLIPSSCSDAIPVHHRTLAAEWRSQGIGVPARDAHCDPAQAAVDHGQ